MLILFADVNGWSEVELYSYQPINLNFRFTELQEINKPAASYSQTFRVPLTPHNADIFGVFDLTLVSSYDYKRRIPARFMSDGITLVEGFLQVKSWYVTKGKYADIELAFFGDAASLSRNIGDQRLQDVNTASYNFSVTYNSITAGGAGTLYSGRIRFGLVDRGFNWTSTSFPSSPSLARLKHSQITPFVSINLVFSLIMEDAGLTFDSDFFDTTGREVYLMALSSESLQRTYSVASRCFGIGLAFNFVIPSTGTIALPFSESGVFYDNGNDYNPATYRWNPPFDGSFTFLVRMNASAPTTLAIVGSTSGSTNVFTSLSGDNFSAVTLDFVAGESVTFEATASSGTILYAGALGAGSTSVVLYNFAEESGIPLFLAKNFPDIKSIDFVAGLQKSFNLVFIQDKNVPTHYYIEPFSDYMSAGAVKDWTNKLDTEKDYQVTPTTDLQKREYIFSHEPSEDFANELAQNITGEVHGRKRIVDPSNDFASGTMEIKSPFAPFLVTRIEDTEHHVLKLTKDGNSIANPRAMLAYWNGEGDTDITTTDDSGSPATLKFPIWSESSDFVTDVTDKSLIFGHPRPLREIIATPLNSLYYFYWRKFANELYSPDARIFEGVFYLTPADIQAFEWSDRIYLFSTYWRVIEISGYDATREGLTKVRLLKILGDIRDCTQLPTSGKGGIIQFEPTSASVECCERYGYVYDFDGRKCTMPVLIE